MFYLFLGVSRMYCMIAPQMQPAMKPIRNSLIVLTRDQLVLLLGDDALADSHLDHRL